MPKQPSKPTKTDKITVFIALGFDDQHKPRGARYVDPNVDVLTKAAAAMSGRTSSTKPKTRIERPAVRRPMRAASSTS